MKNIIIEYNYSPSLTGKLRTVGILIYENFEFRFEIFYHKKPDGRPFDEMYYRSLRNHVELMVNFQKRLFMISKNFYFLKALKYKEHILNLLKKKKNNMNQMTLEMNIIHFFSMKISILLMLILGISTKNY